jgi:hypothetical protein
MKIAKVRATLLLNPDGPHFQDSTMPEAMSGLAIVLLASNR